MEPMTAALEVTGTVDENHELQLDTPLPISGPTRVRVIILYSPVEEWDEAEWRHAASRSPAFDSLKDPAEDIYTLADGRPFHDQA